MTKKACLFLGFILGCILLVNALPLFGKEKKEEKKEGQGPERVWEPSEQYLRLEVGGTFHIINFASDATSEIQAVAYGETDHYELRMLLGYINKYFEQAFLFGFGGTYHPWSPLALSLDANFAPDTTIAARQDYRPSFLLEVFKERVWLGGEYDFRDYRQADLHEAGPLVRVAFPKKVWWTGRYLAGRTLQSSGASFDNQAFSLRIDWRALESVTLWGLYGRSGHDFEAGAPDNPFKSYLAHDYGGGFKLHFLMSGGFFFDFLGENRNNGQVYNTFTIGTFFEL